MTWLDDVLGRLHFIRHVSRNAKARPVYPMHLGAKEELINTFLTVSQYTVS
jgi:hypothetical protein